MKKISAKKLPKNPNPPKTQIGFNSNLYKILYTIPIAGFNGLIPTFTLLPAKSIAAKYEEDKIIVYTTESFVNLVFSSVEHKYINTNIKPPIVSKKIAFHKFLVSISRAGLYSKVPK